MKTKWSINCILICNFFTIFTTVSSAQPAAGVRPVVTDFAALEKEMLRKDDTLRVFNFMASWCRPCVAELPAFRDAAARYRGKKVKVVLVSLDFTDQIDSKLLPLLTRMNWKGPVRVLDETGNDWISQVDDRWDGAIPVTLFVHTKKRIRSFHTGEMSAEELKHYLDQALVD